MKFAVFQLRDRGLVLKRSQLAAPVVVLEVADWSPPNLSNRWQRKSEVRSSVPYGASRPALISPLFDPQIMRADASGIYIMGTEIDSERLEDGTITVREQIQV